MILTADEYGSVRAALDVSLDADTLSDAVIELPIYAGKAELEVFKRDPSYASRTGVDGTHIRLALIFFCAAEIAPAMPSLTSETQGDYSYGRSAVNWTARRADLKARAEEEIAAVVAPSDSMTTFPTFFAVASGNRGQ